MHRTRLRKLAVVVLIVVAASITAWASIAQGSTASSSQSVAKKKNITFISGNIGIPYYIGMGCAMKQEAKKLGVNFNIVGPGNFDATLQIPIVNAVNAKKPDAVIITPTDSRALIGPMKSMSQRGIKLVQVDTSITKRSFVSSSITANNFKGGQQMANLFLKMVAGKSGPVLLLDNSPGASATIARGNGVMSIMKKHPEFKVYREFDQNQAAKDTQVTSAFFSAHPDAVGVLTVYNLGVIGALPALRSTGKLGKIPVLTFDADPVVISQLKKGYIQATFAQQIRPMGTLAVLNAVKAIRGEHTAKYIALPMKQITSKTVGTPAARKLYYPATCK